MRSRTSPPSSPSRPTPPTCTPRRRPARPSSWSTCAATRRGRRGASRAPSTCPTARSRSAHRASSIRSSRVVVYCWSPGCNAGAKGAVEFAKLGYGVKEMIGGYEYWVREGQPTENDEGAAPPRLRRPGDGRAQPRSPAERPSQADDSRPSVNRVGCCAVERRRRELCRRAARPRVLRSSSGSTTSHTTAVTLSRVPASSARATHASAAAAASAMRMQERCDLGIRNIVGEAVAAQQPSVARRSVELDHRSGVTLRAAERRGDEVATGVGCRIRRSTPDLVDQCLDEESSRSRLRQRAVAQPVRPGVAGVREQQRRRRGRRTDPVNVVAMPRERRIALHVGAQVPVRRRARCRRAGPASSASEPAGREPVDERRRGQIARRPAADAVGDGSSPGRRERGILVDRAVQPDVGGGSGSQPNGHAGQRAKYPR